jgi:hypothetical protein
VPSDSPTSAGCVACRGQPARTRPSRVRFTAANGRLPLGLAGLARVHGWRSMVEATANDGLLHGARAHVDLAAVGPK